VDTYIVVIEEHRFHTRHWTIYSSKEDFLSQYRQSSGKIIDQGISKFAAMRLCGANEAMVKDLELAEQTIVS
jgi:hypothetical protein